MTANAFLVPLELTDDVQAAKAKAANVIPSLFNHNTQSINLDCSSCPFALTTERNGAHEWTNDIKSDLHMSVKAEQKHLFLNGKSFYPATIQDLPGALYATQVKKDGESGQGKDVKLSYTVEVDHDMAVDGNELITVTMSILGIDTEMIKVDDIAIKTIKQADGSVSISLSAHFTHYITNDILSQLLLVSVNSVPASANDANCGNIMCRVMTKFGQAMQKARAKAAAAAAASASAANKVKGFCMRCFQRMRGHTAVPHGGRKPTHLPTHIVTRPGDFGAHRGSSMHQASKSHNSLLHSVFGFARRIFMFVIVPVMVGVVLGMTASAIGMLVGHCIVLLWLKFRRSGDKQQGVYESVEIEDKEEGLPPYDASGLPAYADVDDEKKEIEESA